MVEGDGKRGARVRARIGVISDTHGYLDRRVPRLFRGVTHIIHAGDVVDPAILGRVVKVDGVPASTSRPVDLRSRRRCAAAARVGKSLGLVCHCC